jgi:hypothetical protein
MAGMRAVFIAVMLSCGASLGTDARANGSVQGFVYAQGTMQGLFHSAASGFRDAGSERGS